MNANRNASLPVLAISLLALSACGGSEGDKTQMPASVSYAEQRAGKGAIGDYMDAEWLFKNYFEEYGVPAEAKTKFLPTLKLLANGFAVKLRRGDDVKASIEQFHRVATTYATIGDGRALIRRLQDGGSDFEYPPLVTSFGFTDQQIAQNTSMAVQSFSISLTEEEQAAVLATQQDDARTAEENQQKIASYGLPYPLPGAPVPYIFFEQVLKKSGGGSGGGSPSGHPDVRQWRWSPGDVFWADGLPVAGVIPPSGAIGVGHVGLVDAYLEPQTVVDAHPDNPNEGVAIWRDMNAWAARYTEVRQYSPRLAWDRQQFLYGNYAIQGSIAAQSNIRVSALHYARAQVGKGYNQNFIDPWRTSQFYCSSLVWRSFWEAGFNILTYRPEPGKVIFVQEVIFGNVAQVNRSKRP